MKHSIILMLVLSLAACSKNQPRIQYLSINDMRTEPVIVTWDTANICFDGTRYHVPYCISGLKQGKDKVYGGTKVYQTKDTLDRVQLMSKNGCGSFQTLTGESGMSVKIIMWVVAPSGRTWKFGIHGSNILCQKKL